MRRFPLRRVAALVPVAALGVATLGVMSPAGAIDPPTVNVGNVTIVEGDGGTSNTMKFPVTLSDPAGSDVIVQWSITPITATPGADYTALKKPKTTKIRAGKTAAFASVKELPDSSAEPDETFLVTIDSILSGSAVLGDHPTGTGTIVDDDGATGTTVSVGDAAAVETNTGLPKVALPLTLSSPLPSSEVWITWTVVPGSAEPVSDYKPLNKPKVTKIKAGKTNAQATISLYGDTDFEPDESFTVQIMSVSVIGTPAAVDVLRDTGTGGVLDDDGVPVAPGAPTNVVAALTPENFAHVTWDPPTTGDAPTQYNYEYTPDGGTTWINLGSGGATPEFTIEMSPGTYQFHIQAENGGGTSPWSDPSNEITVPESPCNPFCSG
jgi:hypothetical protein